MLSVEQNERLCRVGKGTPMGELFRRYWLPIAGEGDLVENPVQNVRILGEDLVLFKTKNGELGLIDQRCPHRNVDMGMGIPDAEGLRCMYHGWMMAPDGQCKDMPLEPEGTAFTAKVTVPAYPVQELGGLIWAYMGPEPAPLLPRWDILVWPNAFRHIGKSVLDCNWLQCMENSVDTGHVEWNHGWWTEYEVFERQGGTGDPVHDETVHRLADALKRKHLKMEWKPFEYGIMKYRLREGEDPNEAPDWNIGHPLVFPYMVRLGSSIRNEFQIRIPIDDEHTLHLEYLIYSPGPDVKVAKQEYVPVFDHPMWDENGKPIVDYVVAQDMAAWWGQKEITDRSIEWLGTSDKGVIMYRKMLEEQMKIVEDGGDPICTFRDPSKNEIIDLEVNAKPGKMKEKAKSDLSSAGFVDSLFIKYHMVERYSPHIDEIIEIYNRYNEARAKAIAAQS